MTEDQIVGLRPALTDYLGDFRGFFPRKPTFGHLGVYCRGLLSDLEHKSVEPIALAAGAADTAIIPTHCPNFVVARSPM